MSAPRVKPLEWKRLEGRAQALSPFGVYDLYWHPLYDTACLYTPNGNGVPQEFKAASKGEAWALAEPLAQADFAARVLACLMPEAA